ncbi:TPA_asm: hypothetical protein PROPHIMCPROF_30 [Mycobacterium phage McProf]|uniref:hypothetical protein n=1 Tax=Mycobacteroides chelonae TaxID=1774 RepID=UPI000618D932|nr:hypothetical protein [Mycobacteroides chelonae]VEG15702.1 Uncharacterised protein [Mycolicibacterium phlei]DAZ90018.1 TPA_asm: hypothetical protein PROPHIMCPROF_30 [Mycobacterium phage McProf]AKC41222.1 hypothetical protein GR01_07320 [Mycobacteroides chelonae]ANA97670.1 hypothetical protein BB28_07790 [Mycobacteroides chelonae CCUG 47445]OLT75678.1 hypothetical protein BKG56_15810 [Mycobacteroides chelonae]
MNTGPTNKRWLRKLIRREPHQLIYNSYGELYLKRWYVIPRNPLLNVYVHQFIHSDDDRAPHDHPWWFVSWVLKGHYFEHTDTGVIRRERWSWAFRRAVHRHRVELPSEPTWNFDRDEWQEVPAWTLLITGRRVRQWGFWCPTRYTVGLEPYNSAARFVPWQDFGVGGCGE